MFPQKWNELSEKKQGTTEDKKTRIIDFARNGASNKM